MQPCKFIELVMVFKCPLGGIAFGRYALRCG